MVDITKQMAGRISPIYGLCRLHKKFCTLMMRYMATSADGSMMIILSGSIFCNTCIVTCLPAFQTAVSHSMYVNHAKILKVLILIS